MFIDLVINKGIMNNEQITVSRNLLIIEQSIYKKQRTMKFITFYGFFLSLLIIHNRQYILIT